MKATLFTNSNKHGIKSGHSILDANFNGFPRQFQKFLNSSYFLPVNVFKYIDQIATLIRLGIAEFDFIVTADIAALTC